MTIIDNVSAKRVFMILPAFYSASILEGEQLVKTARIFDKMTVGAHSVAVFALLILGYCEVGFSISRARSSLRTSVTHLFAFCCLIAGTVYNISSLMGLQRKGAPLERHDPALRQYLMFCQLFVLITLGYEYLLSRLIPKRPQEFKPTHVHVLSY